LRFSQELKQLEVSHARRRICDTISGQAVEELALERSCIRI